MATNDISNMSVRVVGTYKGNQIRLYSYPQRVAITIGTSVTEFRNVDEAFLYLRQLASMEQQRTRLKRNLSNARGDIY